MEVQAGGKQTFDFNIGKSFGSSAVISQKHYLPWLLPRFLDVAQTLFSVWPQP